MPNRYATFKQIRESGHTLAEWLEQHRGHAIEPIAPLAYEQWVIRLNAIGR